MSECNCKHKVHIPGENMPETSSHLWECPALKCYWFYYEEGADCWAPWPDDLETVIGGINDSKSVEPIEVEFKRVFMSQDEFENLPQV